MLVLKPLPRILPKRLSERKVVTIIAGFRCNQGIVICADTQETVGELSKRHVTKVRVEPHFGEMIKALGGSDLAASFCGAGNGPFIELLTRKAWRAVADATSLEQACDEIQFAIKDTYQEYGRIYQPGYCPSVDLIYGVRMNGESQLFSATGPVINPIDGYCTGGAGYYMADFLAARMYTGYLSLYQCVVLAAYVLFQAKEHVDGCGGDSHIAVLRHSGESGIVDRSRVEAITKLLSGVDRQLGQVLLASSDLTTETDVAEKLRILSEVIGHDREAAKEEIRNNIGWMLSYGPKDDFGFTLMPSTSETLEDQP